MSPQNNKSDREKFEDDEASNLHKHATLITIVFVSGNHMFGGTRPGWRQAEQPH